MREVELKWYAWHGDRPLTLTFPAAWEITIHGNDQPHAMDSDALKEKIRNPIGSPPLHILARKSKRTAIVIDDITRPTPTAILLPPVIEELARGGIGRDEMVIVIGSGAHRKATQEDILKKLGPNLASEFSVVAHDCEKDLLYWGQSPDGVPIHVNRHVMACDLRIGVGSIFPHPFAGFSGGSKIIAPGVCGKETVRYLHDYMNGYLHDYNKNVGLIGCSADNRFRRAIDRITAEVGLDFSINAVLNHQREIGDLFAGHRTSAFQQGARLVSRLYRVDGCETADIIIANTYPFDNCLRYMLRGFWPLVRTKPNATTIAIGAAPEGIGDQGLNPTVASFGLRGWERFRKFKPHLLHHEIRIGINILKKRANHKRKHDLVLCPGISNGDFASVFPNSKRFDTWPDLLKVLEHTYKNRTAKVAIYPYAPLQFPRQNRDVK